MTRSSSSRRVYGTGSIFEQSGPTLIAAISDAVVPVARAPAVGVYRFWRDMGYVAGGAGGLLAGVVADSLGYGGAIAVVAALTAGSGLWVLAELPGRGLRAGAQRVVTSC